MKTLLICVAFAILFRSHGIGQTVETGNVSIAYDKTTSLIFPFAISSVDRGSPDVLVQKANGVENVLQLKAGRRDFQETNLTVITADGVLYQFTVNFSDSPAVHALNIAGSEKSQGLILAKDAINAREVMEGCHLVLHEDFGGKIVKKKAFQISLTLHDIFVQDEILYFRLRIRNRSSINYDVKSLKYFIRDKKNVKRTSSQELEVVPVHIGDKTDVIEAYASSIIVYAVRKFTIPDGKALHINLFEENGGRSLLLRIDNRDILKAKLIPRSNELLSITKN